ncbi:Endosomal/prevacuolar sodium/hydrogen exchanger [Frankliniella fusca]|uniref:Endosomal/prevacuolar sodium/hydrogen exchanger n=1 Tax=Frankliniella fusca TaxID=407009 RepID=A0AAE1H6L8_9NEOP|nr:Endosomal/prevacuolar sodium/hydrogen exchanger [Frankliniella fusca]KAK3928903.1 Endosomal/prevacuolar sodium/hydrogen exchanger [Frankliniella fusca]
MLMLSLQHENSAPNSANNEYNFKSLKVKLGAQCTTMAEFFKHFGLAAQKKRRKAVFLSNVNEESHFGLQMMHPQHLRKMISCQHVLNPRHFKTLFYQHIVAEFVKKPAYQRCPTTESKERRLEMAMGEANEDGFLCDGYDKHGVVNANSEETTGTSEEGRFIADVSLAAKVEITSPVSLKPPECADHEELPKL